MVHKNVQNIYQIFYTLNNCFRVKKIKNKGNFKIIQKFVSKKKKKLVKIYNYKMIRKLVKPMRKIKIQIES